MMNLLAIAGTSVTWTHTVSHTHAHSHPNTVREMHRLAERNAPAMHIHLPYHLLCNAPGSHHVEENCAN